jgi:hypothetical protein
VSRFPDDVEGLRFVVSVLPGVGGNPVKGKYNYNLLAVKNERIANHATPNKESKLFHSLNFQLLSLS